MSEFIDGQRVEVSLGEVGFEAAFEIQETVLELRLIQRVYC